MIIGVDLGGMSAKAAVLSEEGLLGKARIETSVDRSIEQTASDLARLCKQAAVNAGVPFDKIEAIGIGSPGVIDSSTGTVVSWTNFFWKDVPLGSLVSNLLQKPCFVTNDANAAALGEAKFGAGKNYSDSVFVTIGTGVGGGIVIDGKLFEGYKSAGAELGHTVIRQNGELCTCGRRGCFERYASTSALIRLTREKMKENTKSAMWKFAETVDDVDGRTSFLAAKQGDESAKKVITEFIAALGEGIANVVNLLRPQAIIIGGGISAEGDVLLKPLKDYVYANIYVAKEYAPLEIVCAELGNDAGLYGAAVYAQEHL
ncbi:MAG: ROK family protein [Clostridiales bacterium]|nr:ROK family protein [Clostridiales bacterium]